MPDQNTDQFSQVHIRRPGEHQGEFVSMPEFVAMVDAAMNAKREAAEAALVPDAQQAIVVPDVSDLQDVPAPPSHPDSEPPIAAV